MKIGQILFWALVALVAFLLITQPHQTLHLAGTVMDGLANLFSKI